MFGSAALLAAIGSAHAADISARPAPVYAPPMTAPAPTAYNWSGAYAGLSGGYGWTNFDSDSAAVASDGDGWLLGGYVGYNIQSPSNWVFGLEADAHWSGISGTGGGARSDLNWISTLRGRAGMAFDRFLVYGTGGLAVAGVELNDGTATDKNTHFGWVIGAGVETAISQNLTARLEYNYVSLNEKDYTGAADYTASPNASIIKAGIGFKF
jgi:outer membrane immunogenic protein